VENCGIVDSVETGCEPIVPSDRLKPGAVYALQVESKSVGGCLGNRARGFALVAEVARRGPRRRIQDIKTAKAAD